MLEILEKPEIKFPVARKGVDRDGLIVLFWGPTTGVILSKGNSFEEIGYVATDWCPCNDPKTWQPVDLEITG